MASFDDSDDKSYTNPGVENEPGILYRTRSPISQTTKSLKSRRSTRPVTVQDQTSNRRSTLTPIQRFRVLVQKVIHLNTASRHLSGKRLGAEPGIDVRKNSAFLDYGHIMQSYLIEVVDYSSTRSSFRKLARRQPVSTPLGMTMATAMSDTDRKSVV